ncbi:hypothetical protein GE061_000514 [Apolygus lucorum]|uniref:Knr4/Smi1-like domain-containing protein n=1 Tax=Apolygus lucorum TaxID=248454 RepID=A0A8S9Y5T3_APOLU|nr:hypothetical protein GE061_000514 [Apolygus lucorum]
MIKLITRTSWKYQTREFFENSTLHGVRYIAEKERPIYEKLMWFSFVVIGAIVTLIIIVSLWEKFQTNPTITGLDTDFHSWDVPFPGVTICPSSPALTTRIETYITKKWGQGIPESKIEYYSKFINLIANFSYVNLKEIVQYKTDKNLPQKDFRQLLYEVAVRCEDFLSDCVFKMERDGGKCCVFFSPTFTEKGYCYSFNSLYSENQWPWKTDEKEGKIRYIYETDVTWSLELVARIAEINSEEMSVYIHSPNELPGMEMAPQHLWNNQIDKIFFAARTTYTTEAAKQLTIKQRKCVFKDEVKLPTASEYSYWACMSNCRMMLAMEKCSCVPFFHHAVKGFPYCSLDGLVCLAAFADDFIQGVGCSCELGCDNTVYEVEKFNDGEQQNYTLEVGFVSWPMIRYKREVLFGWVDLLVAFGGIAGLFLGFSLLSGVEIIYYFTLRSFCMVYRNKSELVELKHEAENRPLPKIDLGLSPDLAAVRNSKSMDTAEIVTRIVTQGGKGKKPGVAPLSKHYGVPYDVSEENFHDHLTLGLARTLNDLPGVQNVTLEKREPCEKSLLNSWEQRHSCILPFDLKNFYLSTDGFLLTWCFCNGGEEIPIGNLHINSLSKLRRLAGVNGNFGDVESSPSLLDLDPFVSKSQKERPLFKSTCKVFELDTCRDVASVCLVYVEHKINPSIWLLDRSLEWHFLSPSFTQYFRMMLVYQGLPEWQYNLTTIGLAPWAQQLMYTFTPHLHSPPSVRKDICSTEVQLDPSIFKVKSKHSKKSRAGDTHDEPREGKSSKGAKNEATSSSSGSKHGNPR